MTTTSLILTLESVIYSVPGAHSPCVCDIQAAKQEQKTISNHFLVSEQTFVKILVLLLQNFTVLNVLFQPVEFWNKCFAVYEHDPQYCSLHCCT